MNMSARDVDNDFDYEAFLRNEEEVALHEAETEYEAAVQRLLRRERDEDSPF